jgi:hypothetical protein
MEYVYFWPSYIFVRRHVKLARDLNLQARRFLKILDNHPYCSELSRMDTGQIEFSPNQDYKITRLQDYVVE